MYFLQHKFTALVTNKDVNFLCEVVMANSHITPLSLFLYILYKPALPAVTLMCLHFYTVSGAI